jgi:stearoyl-CoA desaturase (delta-9 desaturase)
MWKTLTTLPFHQLRKNRYFYVWYDGTYLVLLSVLVAAMAATQFPGLITQWRPGLWLFLPLACYGQILCSVFIHNCTHGNFPRPINRLVGELCGVIVLTRFASWEIIHQRHHRYSDDPKRDPHPVEPSYWKFLWHTIYNVEAQLQTIFVELYGETPENRAYERRRAYLSYATNLVLIYAWYRLLGPLGFFVFFVPSAIVGFLHLVHFNWSTHNAFSKDMDFRPVNLDEGWFWLGNRLFFGIYAHANHHKRPDFFNPLRYKAQGRAWSAAPGESAAPPAVAAPGSGVVTARTGAVSEGDAH